MLKFIFDRVSLTGKGTILSPRYRCTPQRFSFIYYSIIFDFMTEYKMTIHDKEQSILTNKTPIITPIIIETAATAETNINPQFVSRFEIRKGPINPDMLPYLNKTREQIEEQKEKTKVKLSFSKKPDNNEPRDKPLPKHIREMANRFKKKPPKYVPTSNIDCGDVS